MKTSFSKCTIFLAIIVLMATCVHGQYLLRNNRRGWEDIEYLTPRFRQSKSGFGTKAISFLNSVLGKEANLEKVLKQVIDSLEKLANKPTMYNLIPMSTKREGTYKAIPGVTAYQEGKMRTAMNKVALLQNYRSDVLNQGMSIMRKLVLKTQEVKNAIADAKKIVN